MLYYFKLSRSLHLQHGYNGGRKDASRDLRVNMCSHVLKLHIKAPTVRLRPTLNVERFRNGSVRDFYERSSYKRIILN